MAKKATPETPAADDGCRIVELRARNFARLTAVTIRPSGRVTQITGANGEGKTSVLRAIEAGIRGKSAGPEEPIHRGTDGAELYLDLGELIVTRSILRGEDGKDEWSLKIAAKDGSRITRSPQAVLDGFYSAVGFQPVPFIRGDKHDRVKMLKRLVEGFDFEDNARKRKDTFDARTDVNRRAKQARASAATIELPPGKRPEAVDVDALILEMRTAGEHNQQLEARKARRTATATEIEGKRDEAERLRMRADALEAEASDLEEKLTAAPALPGLIDTTALQEQIASAREIEMARSKFHRRDSFTDEAVTAEGESAELTTKIEALDNARDKAIADAKLPGGLGLDLETEDATLNGLPFSQASGAEQVRAAIGVMMALNPRLRVLLVDEGEKLDSKSMAIVEQMAAEHGFDIWITVVNEDGDVGIIIEDGKVK